jgi:hypothetical protein
MHMLKIVTTLLLSIPTAYCFAQRIDTVKNNKPNIAINNEPQNGIVYFSYDEGKNWVNASDGLPQITQIGLGGIASSNTLLAVATKNKGVYIFNAKTKTWNNITTIKKIIDANIGALTVYDNTIFIGTQQMGVFYTNNKGKSWHNINTGLTNVTVRRFCMFNKTLYVCTNNGFYTFNKKMQHWQLIYGQALLQINNATFYNNSIYLATDKGIFKQQSDSSWVHSSPQFSMHSISSDNNQLYAMTYNELLQTSNDGYNWQSNQEGLPNDLYTFNVINYNNKIFAAQWDGVYKKNTLTDFWELYSNGLSPKFAVTNLCVFNKILVISTSERKLKN